MERVAFTIVFNGKRHLHHADFLHTMLRSFDLWAVVEGAAVPTGSTSWCRPVAEEYIRSDGHSADGTWEELQRLSRQRPRQVLVDSVRGMNKDCMVNRAVDMLAKAIGAEKPTPWLWQVDVDEVWSCEKIRDAEFCLSYMNGNCGSFICDYYVGKNIVARGDWGEGRILPYRRLWKWDGMRRFQTHEPPELVGGNGPTYTLPQRFDHYAYYFRKDVEFKGKFYSGHDGVLPRWDALQVRSEFPVPASVLISGPWGRTNTVLDRIVK